MASHKVSRIDRLNRRIGWASLVVGATTGLFLGVFVFVVPLPAPDWLGGYEELPRRLVRMAHISLMAIGILNILLARELSSLTLSEGAKATASWSLVIANFLLPVTLFAASAYPPAKFALPVPALAIFLALGLTAWGVLASDKGGVAVDGDRT